MSSIVAAIVNIIYIMCILSARHTFVDASARKNVVAGSGVGSGLAARGSAFSSAGPFRHDFAIVPRLGVASL
jgi:hypothetical protein